MNAPAWLAIDMPPPFVVVGSDIGALEALVAGAELPDVLAGLVLAGTPFRKDAGARGLGRRTGLANRVPGPGEARDPGTHPARLRRCRLARGRCPTPCSAHLVGTLRGRRGGRHDVLNDAFRRSVAAEIVQFLERIRSSEDAVPILRVEVG